MYLVEIDLFSDMELSNGEENPSFVCEDFTKMVLVVNLITENGNKAIVERIEGD